MINHICRQYIVKIKIIDLSCYHKVLDTDYCFMITVHPYLSPVPLALCSKLLSFYFYFKKKTRRLLAGFTNEIEKEYK